MDFEKSYLKEVDKEKTKVQENISRPQSRPQSISKPEGYRGALRARTQSRPKGATSTPHPPPPTATLELKVLKNPTPRSSRLPTKQTKPQESSSSSRPQSAVIPEQSKEPPIILRNPNDLVHAHGLGENYDIFTRPSTGKSSNDGGVPSPSELLAEVTNLKTRMDHDAQLEKDEDVVEVEKLPELPVVRSSWLPVEDDGDTPKLQEDKDDIAGAVAAGVKVEEGEYSDTDSYSQVSEDINQLGKGKIKENDDNNNSGETPKKVEPADPEEEADDEVFCDQTGYDEDTEDGGDDAEVNDGEDSDGDAEETRPSRDARKKRKLKRVVKYEYREEYVLNGMAQFKLPNSAQLEKLRSDYINKASKDPNCRGYGFV